MKGELWIIRLVLAKENVEFLDHPYIPSPAERDVPISKEGTEGRSIIL